MAGGALADVDADAVDDFVAFVLDRVDDRAGEDEAGDELTGVEDEVTRVDGTGVGDGDPDPAAFDEPPPEVKACTVTISSTMTSTAEPTRRRRRRQYTEGGWDPTG
ncbi:hypothetical protein [uncultured Jatrophihabitans sp.]|uniref:hypothetical protein n=1 Tax=uncultured Jatrophihabitans sp. TaxID=1610747 RepID=UPI0035CAC06C